MNVFAGLLPFLSLFLEDGDDGDSEEEEDVFRALPPAVGDEVWVLTEISPAPSGVDGGLPILLLSDIFSTVLL